MRLLGCMLHLCESREVPLRAFLSKTMLMVEIELSRWAPSIARYVGRRSSCGDNVSGTPRLQHLHSLGWPMTALQLPVGSPPELTYQRK
uniref:Uncharacterized protein n=1 Tax=Physcomitrium patens TaxID=3218 RepID=A0A2K1JUN8_PHYPA|nr:hypothetical protein PHYPA_015009 [Physcomitrium patens]